jgi:hypothetical protein
VVFGGRCSVLGYGRGQAKGEIAAVALTGLAFWAFESLCCHRLLFIVPCAGLWGAYVALRVGRDRSELRRWGIRADNLRAAWAPCFAVFAAGALALFGCRIAVGWKPLPSSWVFVVLLYPVWALFQQFFVQSLLAGNLRRLGVPPAAIVPVAAILFVHAPNWALVALCAVAGAIWTTLFLRTPNLIPLVLCHGWLGALVYYWVLGRDPWLELLAGR